MKRKVTDLLPNEAILISNDAERDAVLNIFHEAGIKWASGKDVTNWYPSFNYPFGLQLSAKKLFNEPLWYLDKLSCTMYPATDFIGSEFSGKGLTVIEPDNTISIEPSETIATLRAEKAELIEALETAISKIPRKKALKAIAKYETK
jgi:hypothetical protein